MKITISAVAVDPRAIPSKVALGKMDLASLRKLAVKVERAFTVETSAITKQLAAISTERKAKMDVLNTVIAKKANAEYTGTVMLIENGKSKKVSKLPPAKPGRELAVLKNGKQILIASVVSAPQTRIYKTGYAWVWKKTAVAHEVLNARVAMLQDVLYRNPVPTRGK